MTLSLVGEVEVPTPLERIVRESAFSAGKTIYGLVYGLSQSERDEICGWLLRIEHPYCRTVRREDERIVKIVEDLRESLQPAERGEGDDD